MVASQACQVQCWRQYRPLCSVEQSLSPLSLNWQYLFGLVGADGERCKLKLSAEQALAVFGKVRGAASCAVQRDGPSVQALCAALCAALGAVGSCCQLPCWPWTLVNCGCPE